MSNRYRPLLWAIATVFTLPVLLTFGAAQANDGLAEAATTIVLVRHAEKRSDQGSDPGLTEAGQARAEALATVLKDAGVDRIYTTQLQRTWLTAMPTAQAAGKASIHVDIAFGQVEAFIDEMVKRLRGEAGGETVLVVGHSNTVAPLVAALSGRPELAMSEAEYDRLTTLVLSQSGDASLIRARYGKPSGD